MENQVAPVRGMSLERKLPLLMTAVLLVVLVAGVLVVDREVRRAAQVVTAHKVDEASSSIAHLLEGNGSRVSETMGPATHDSAVVRALTTPSPSAADVAALRSRLNSLSIPLQPADSSLLSEVWTADGRVLARGGDTSVLTRRPPVTAVTTGRNAVTLGSFYASGGRVYYWATMPVIVDGRRVGTIAQRRRLNSQPAAEKAISSLVQPGVVILLANTDGSLWSTLGGTPVNAPSHLDSTRTIPTVNHPDINRDERMVLYKTAADGTPWTVAVELPVSKLDEGQRNILNRFALISLLLLVLGGLAVWIISRRITLPLTRMTVAAEAMARGDYSHRVPEGGDYEIARLGASFNRMATEVEAANLELQATAAAAEKAQNVAEEANAAKANFLAAMSHELRTPLNAIAGYVELLAMGLRGPLNDEQRADLSRIKKSQEYLLGLIEQVLVFTQLDARKVAITIEDVRLDSLLHDAETMVRPQINARGIDFAYRASDPDLVVRADREKAQQIVLNLITNGAKYTNPGGSVTVESEPRNGSVHVRVTDTGPGIPEKMLAHIFEPFVQLDRRLNQPREGVGLGLTISRDLARAMGGDLTVKSKLGEGSTFTLVLPRKQTR
ncbi:MAG TPA: HAMP domain-containing sensor histidine kinase [Gemmatimonadaceae bacterium]|jgi:signal transduction histidine kinase|nr:HAMP domain-containing sensor histidine kinase [Gemmatimonadaceae bacterium]